MALTKVYVFVPGQIPEFFRAIQQGQAPSLFSMQHLKDIGFSSSNHRAFIPLLKAIGFLSADGQPTQRYHDYRDPSRARRVLGDALKDAYGDLFVIRSNPTEQDHSMIEGKFKSTHNVSDGLAKRMANTFFALLTLSDIDDQTPEEMEEVREAVPISVSPPSQETRKVSSEQEPSLHYNIQIHLPATKDIEVFNAIFKSLREHLLD